MEITIESVTFQEPNDPSTVLSHGGLLPLGGTEATGMESQQNRILRSSSPSVSSNIYKECVNI